MKRIFLSLLAFLPLMTACMGERPRNIGVQEGRLAACPDSPNCVSSFETNDEHGIAPIAATLDQIEQVLVELEEANIVGESENYLYAEFTSRLMRYIDDVEFLYDAEARITHVRSASRVGQSDFGVNRDRIEKIRESVR
ncbi:MAG: DUF1499 domain-containing protein [Pseudohongiellaceae bacterium]|tara:strand:- start:137 stop:553 length:417 start_codon:yes stop_codon:yes gene_type:complete